MWENSLWGVQIRDLVWALNLNLGNRWFQANDLVTTVQCPIAIYYIYYFCSDGIHSPEGPGYLVSFMPIVRETELYLNMANWIPTENPRRTKNNIGKIYLKNADVSPSLPIAIGGFDCNDWWYYNTNAAATDEIKFCILGQFLYPSLSRLSTDGLLRCHQSEHTEELL